MGHQPYSSISDAHDRYSELERIELEFELQANQQMVLEAATASHDSPNQGHGRGNHRMHLRVRRNRDRHRHFQQPTSRLRRRNRRNRRNRQVVYEREGIPVIELSDSEEDVARPLDAVEPSEADDDHMNTGPAEDEIMALARQMLWTEEVSEVGSPSHCSSVGSNDPFYDNESDEIAKQDI